MRGGNEMACGVWFLWIFWEFCTFLLEGNDEMGKPVLIPSNLLEIFNFNIIDFLEIILYFRNKSHEKYSPKQGNITEPRLAVLVLSLLPLF